MAPAGGAEPRYAAANAELEPERDRLQLLERLHDPATLRRIDHIGVTDGWRCLEIGAGAGSVARALSERAGSKGLVVATDRDPRFLDDFAGAGRSVLTHDITESSVPPGDFDFAHCRAVLAHVEDLAGAVGNIVRSVRSGGWVLCEEPDYGSLQPCDPNHHHAPDLAALQSIMTHGNRVDGYTGRKLFETLRTAGLSAIETDLHGAIACGGSLRARYRRDTIAHVRAVAPPGMYSDADFDRMLAMFDDPTFAYIDNAWIAAWGQVRRGQSRF